MCTSACAPNAIVALFLEYGHQSIVGFLWILPHRQRVDGWMMDGLCDGWTDERKKGVDGWINSLMDRWMDEQTWFMDRGRGGVMNGPLN